MSGLALSAGKWFLSVALGVAALVAISTVVAIVALAIGIQPRGTYLISGFAAGYFCRPISRLTDRLFGVPTFGAKAG